MTSTIKYAFLASSCITLTACALFSGEPNITQEQVNQVIQGSFEEKGIAKLDRIQQSDMQRVCSTGTPSQAQRDQIEKEALVSVKYPANGKYLGDWKEGEKIAQNGRGLQFSDKADTVAGGNCYACHQLSPKEISYGNLGPSLLNYGKLRGNSEDILKYTWGKIYNSHAYNACSNMPRFGAAGILTEKQIQDVMALLLSPDSPVNK